MNCENIRDYYYDYLEQADTVPQEVCLHLEQCSVCQNELRRLQDILTQDDPSEKSYRMSYLRTHGQLLGQWLSCDSVKPFLPSFLLPQLSIKYQTPVTAHIENCPACRKDLKAISSLRLANDELIKAIGYLSDEPGATVKFNSQAHLVLERIHNRKPSGVFTRMQPDPGQVQNTEQAWLSGSCTVDVQHRPAVPIVKFPVPAKRAVPVWAASGIAAAVFFVILLMFSTPKVTALDLRQLYAGLELVRNVHIQRFDNTNELENIWISENLGVCLIQQQDVVVFRDERSNQIFEKNHGAVQYSSQGGKTELERPWGLLPFNQISDIPASHDWHYISDAVLDGNLKVKIYELTWKTTRRNQGIIHRKWRGYLDIHSHLPYQIEWLDKMDNSPYQLMTTVKIRYPSDAECLNAIESHGFQRVSHGDQDELRGIFPTASTIGATEDGLFLPPWPSAKMTLNKPE